MQRSIFFLVIICLACSGKKMAEKETQEQSTAEAQLATVPKVDSYADEKTSLIKTVNYRFEVTSVKVTTEAMENAVKKYPSYTSSSSIELHNPMLENKMTIRIASEYFQDLLKEIDQQAIFVNFRNFTSEDISKEFVDLESRLRTKREVEERYHEILQKKAGTIKELLEAEQQIGALHEEIEAAVGRINFLKEQVRYSTINLEFYQTISEKIANEPRSGVGQRFISAAQAGLQGLVAVGVGFMYLWPILLITMIVFGFYRHRRLKKTAYPQGKIYQND